ncbi:MAG: C4-type zinc ribbon domain-containing protein [Acidobacteriales bacterium]|nr:C4-type zinc ribbon domain-containing protein [Terriglobales bacterium]
MNSDLEKLISLQAADREINRLNEEIANLPKRVAAIEAKLAEEKAAVEKAKTAIKNNDAARRKLEVEIQSQQQKISKYREQSLEVKTNEQYKALLHEIEFAEREIRAAEDKILEAMVDTEAREKELKAVEAELKQATAEIETEKAEALRLTEEDEKELANWQGQRQGLRSGISPQVLDHYDRVIKVRKSAIAEARDQKCAACNVMLRPQTYDEIRTNEKIIVCDSCNRILFFDPAHQPQEQAPAKARKKKAAPVADEIETGVTETPEVPARS